MHHFQLISLKAELLRKQDEVNKAKLEPKNQINNFVPSSKFEKEQEIPEKIAIKKPAIDAEEAEALRKSKYIIFTYFDRHCSIPHLKI